MILNIVQDLDQKSGGVPKVARVVEMLLQKKVTMHKQNKPENIFPIEEPILGLTLLVLFLE